MKPVSHQRTPRVQSSETLTPSSSHKQRTPRINKENIDPVTAPPESTPFLPSSSPVKPVAARNRIPLPPRSPSSNPLKRKLGQETFTENAALASDSGVQVIVRMRPPNMDEEEGDQIVQKISPSSLLILDYTFTFDSVADTTSTQQDIYQLVGLPLVENCLAGFNSSIFAYGQTGSGKTYTMWGPLSALSEDDLSSKECGLTPRVFEHLFSRINEEQAKHSDKQLNYQCRCSFLEIYNEQITDLLDPTQRNLQLREDVRTGVYVDSLTEEYVSRVKDVTGLLIKGLSNRRTGATSINTESSRSHCVFTCVVESKSKSMADGLSRLKTSRINLVDLAGSERQKLTGAVGERLKEAGNINRSLSQLGNLINILAEVSQSGKQRHIPYRDSKLTFLLQESLGGNAKLAMICAISPSQGCKSETFSTLRFAQRAKAIKNKAVINEVTQDDVNVLREQIRQLKDELLRMKSNGTSAEKNGTYSTGWNARRSLNLLKMSLNRPTVLPARNDDSDEEMEADEDDVETPVPKKVHSSSCEEKLQFISKELSSSRSGNQKRIQPTHIPGPGCGGDQVCQKIDAIAADCETKNIIQDKVYSACEKEKYICIEKSQCDSFTVHMASGTDFDLREDGVLSKRNPLDREASTIEDSSAGKDSSDISVTDPSHYHSSSPNTGRSLSSLSIMPCETSAGLHSPILGVSPVVGSCSRKSIRTSSLLSASQKSIENVKLDPDVLSLSFAGSLDRKCDLSKASNVRTSKDFVTSTECLAASLHRGLQVIKNHHHTSALRRSSFQFSLRPIELKPLVTGSKVDIGVQTVPQELEVLAGFPTYICSCCNKKAPSCEDVGGDPDLQLVPVDEPESTEKLKILVPKAVEKVLAGAIRREMALEDHCMKQAAEISQLDRLVQQYKHERECNAIIEQTREDKISRLESLVDGISSTEEFMEEEFISLTNEHKLLKERYENHPEVMRVNIELKRVQSELDGYRNFFGMDEREVLMEEIQDLRIQLQYYIDSSSLSARKLSLLLHLPHSSEPISTPLGTIPEVTEEIAEEKLERERLLWTEAESKWISLFEELRLELEASRTLAEKRRTELDSEKKCAEELKEALQTAMQGYARILEQYAELQEKHITLLSRHRKMSDGIEDVKRAAAKAGVKGAESKFINSLAAEISALRVEREKERQYWRDENRGLRTQLRDTAEAVQAAGELLVRLKEAEETAAIAKKRAGLAELETEKAYQEIENLKTNYDRQIVIMNQFVAQSRLPKEALRSAVNDADIAVGHDGEDASTDQRCSRPAFSDADVAKYDAGETFTDQRWRREFEPFGQEADTEYSRGTEPYVWYSGYDRCNI